MPNIVSDTARLSAPGFVYRELDLVRVAGKREPVRIHEVIAEEGSLAPERLQELDTFARALSCYRGKQWDDAEELLTRLLETLPAEKRQDSLYNVYIERMEYLRKRTLPDDWDAVFTFDRK
ncbi:MAG: hypothetical protein A3H44_00055 [Gammaproteobacteria bacterium RIFCSPLOWO2_02_FULL_57_10]|nr:MAG: hypothetical protein A3H44_00055 [Gammaproteobacteria bacterium RIFCSPLOWO2_02_FULL_57_10]